MKEVNGRIVDWDEGKQEGLIQDDDGTPYPFTKTQWAEQTQPEIDGNVRVICQNGRDASKVEYILIEHMPQLKTTVYSSDGKTISSERQRFIGGPWRVRSDALGWMMAAKCIHAQASHDKIEDLSNLLKGEHLPISLRGSVVKYCYGMSIELYLKWILTEAKIPYKAEHGFQKLTRKLPDRVLGRLRRIYSDYQGQHQPSYTMMQAHVQGADELVLDWSTFDKFIENLDNLKFVVGRYAVPRDYSIFKTSSGKLSYEMNTYMDSDDFFELGQRVLSHKPSLDDYA